MNSDDVAALGLTRGDAKDFEKMRKELVRGGTDDKGNQKEPETGPPDLLELEKSRADLVFDGHKIPGAILPDHFGLDPAKHRKFIFGNAPTSDGSGAVGSADDRRSVESYRISLPGSALAKNDGAAGDKQVPKTSSRMQIGSAGPTRK